MIHFFHIFIDLITRYPILSILAGIIFPIIYKIFDTNIIPIIQHTILFKKHNKTLLFFNSLFKAKNLKSEYCFIDHASRYDNSFYEDYEEDYSYFSLNNNKSLFLEPMKNINEIASAIQQTGFLFHETIDLKLFIQLFNEEIREEYSDEKLKGQCIGVLHIMHNRDQRKEKDEAHWMRFVFYKLDFYTRILLNRLFLFAIKLNTENFSQPQYLNKAYPFITECKLVCNISYKGDIFIAYYQYSIKDNDYHPILEINFDEFFPPLQSMSLKDVKKIIVNHITNYLSSHNYYEPIKSCYITDIGIENNNLTIFSEIRLSSPLTFNDQFLHSITRKDLISSNSNKLPKELYHSLSNLFIRNS